MNMPSNHLNNGSDALFKWGREAFGRASKGEEHRSTRRETVNCASPNYNPGARRSRAFELMSVIRPKMKFPLQCTRRLQGAKTEKLS